MLGASGLAMLVLCFVVAYALYLDYTVATFHARLARYYAGYVVGPFGLGYGSSLFGGLKLAFGYARWEEAAGLAACAAITAAALACWVGRRIGAAELVFLVAAAYCVGSTVIADYHLLVFLASLMLWAGEQRDGPAGTGGVTPLFLGCVAMLAPKNYLFNGEVSAQVVVNPVLLIACAWLAVVRALPAGRGCPGAVAA